MKNILEIKNLNISFDIDDKEYKCIKDFSLSFKENSFYALVGESGCGKSVLASSIIGLLPRGAKINSGEILFKGENILNSDKQKHLRGKKIVYIPQDPMTSLNPLYTIENQMMEVLDLDKKNENINKKQKIIDALAQVKIDEPEKRLKSYPFELSGGMQQRIIIAMALLVDSEIIIADEPTTALDVMVQAQILDILKNIQKTGRTIILITHDLGVVYKYAEIASVMYLGEVFETKNVQELIKNPAHPYTKALIEALPSKNIDKLKNIKGQPKSIMYDVQGCSFSERCDIADKICFEIHPEFNSIKNVRCHKK